MTSLFLKVTNQMITACKSYVSEKGTLTIWSQSQADLRRKLKDCIKLNQEYQNCFQRTKEKLAQMPDERPFDFSRLTITSINISISVFTNIPITPENYQNRAEFLDHREQPLRRHQCNHCRMTTHQQGLT